MKIHFFSDVHSDVNWINSPDEILDFSKSVDLYIDAGDTGSYLATKSFYENEIWKDKKVVFVGGNHLGYGTKESLDEIDELLRKEFFLENNVSYLNNSEKNFGEYSILGTTLWTDFNLFDKKDISIQQSTRYMNDYRTIKFTNGSFLTPENTISMFNISLKFLKQKLEHNPKKKYIIVTHHTPSIKSSLDIYKNDLITAAYCSNLEDFILKHPNIVLWIHGHVHNTCMYQIGNTYVVCNPVGYIRYNENSGFVKDAILEV